MGSEHECGSDAGAYVLGALDSNGMEAFERHLVTCGACREEVELLQSAADALPLMASRIEAPPTLKTRVMAEVRADAVAQRGAASRGIGYATRDRSAAAPRRRWLTRPVPMPAMAGIGALLVAAVVTVALSRGPSGSRYVPARVAYTGAEATLRVDGRQAELLVKGMPAPPLGKVYEVWVEKGHSAPRPTAALFDVDQAGEAEVAVPGGVNGLSAILVTAERDGGSRVPHGPVLIAAKLA